MNRRNAIEHRFLRLWRPLFLLAMSVIVVACQQDAAVTPTTPTLSPEVSNPLNTMVAAPTASPEIDSPLNTVTATMAAYPAPILTATPAAYPGASATATASSVVLTTPTATPEAEPGQPQATSTRRADIFLPLIRLASSASTPIPLATAPILPLDFAAIQNELNSAGQELAYNKIGLHGSLLDEEGRLLDWMQQLDAAGVPIFLKSVDNAEPIYLAQEMMKASGVPHTLVFRASGGVPNYELAPVEAARLHWQMHRDLFPPELDPSLVWIETINEVDRNLSEWLAQFALETARLALADGFRWAAFGWAAGEPEPEQWQTPSMLEFLRLVGDNPDRLAIALHEGSATTEDVAFQYPYRTGRFLRLFQICDRHGIPRPTILITEWGWEYDHIPPVEKALSDLAWAAALYAPFPQVKGAAIWMIGLGCCFGEISGQVLQLLPALTEFSLTHYFTAPLPPAQARTNPDLYRP